MNFSLGRIACTLKVAIETKESPIFLKFILASLQRFQNCDWGDISEYDKESNNTAIHSKKRILGVYKLENTKIYIITEADRSYTTIMYADEY